MCALCVCVPVHLLVWACTYHSVQVMGQPWCLLPYALFETSSLAALLCARVTGPGVTRYSPVSVSHLIVEH